jgi:ubiquinone/menaquinone biosynthesis C-methylase UbiE
MLDAFQSAGLKRGCRILDIGCGEGGSLEHLRACFGARGVGIDRSATLIEKGKAAYKELDLRVGDADFLEFPSCSFDAVIAECVLSLSEMQIEVVHEAYCVLKPGGKLIVADLCERGAISEKRNVNSREGVIDPIQLEKVCAEIGFEKIYIEDRTKDLDAFAVDILFEYGSFEEYYKSTIAPDQGLNALCRASVTDGKLGYFLLIMEKPKPKTDIR